jgi:hypothetical protein
MPTNNRFPPRHYKGFYIVKAGDAYQVRMTQHFDDGKKLVHVWNPWCGSVNEAKAIVDKLVDHVAGSTRVRGIIKQP